MSLEPSLSLRSGFRGCHSRSRCGQVSEGRYHQISAKPLVGAETCCMLNSGLTFIGNFVGKSGLDGSLAPPLGSWRASKISTSCIGTMNRNVGQAFQPASSPDFRVRCSYRRLESRPTGRQECLPYQTVGSWRAPKRFPRAFGTMNPSEADGRLTQRRKDAKDLGFPFLASLRLCVRNFG